MFITCTRTKPVLQLKRFFILLLLAAAPLLSAPAFAGGSDAPVHIEKLEMLSDTDYVLVVSPAPVADPDPLFGHCSHFEVHGSFEKLDGVPWFVWWYHGGPKKPEHLAALATLRQFLTAGKTIRLGWMGEGFHPVTPENTCIVESRALQLFSDDPLMPAIYSYFHVV